ncbi:PilZ domain protein [Pseudobythopirellula maris]|uniref:PilZ domain protein n=1 Tax=Pseudobythopirellula maris TaxID=2527991 RepID=A0A5C5ZIQ7_9BACT|nr:PilZ domain-containing protein [Pseudobythopirellula maris]TWT86887.1 PilZ domain protein [Pseudobythopirellula maris]
MSAQPSPSGDSQVSQCPRCEAPFTAKPPAEGAAIEVRRCPSCSLYLYATVDADSPAGAVGELRPYHDLSSQRPAQLRKVIDDITVRRKADERRQSDRVEAKLPLVAMSVNGAFYPVSEPLRVFTSNLSISGAMINSPESFTEPLLLLDFSLSGKPGAQAVMKVLRQRPQGDTTEVAGEFLTPLNHPGLH